MGLLKKERELTEALSAIAVLVLPGAPGRPLNLRHTRPRQRAAGGGGSCQRRLHRISSRGPP